MRLGEGEIYVLPEGHGRREVRHEVTERWVQSFAAAVGETRARFFSLDRPGGIVAHPVFPACLEWPLVAAGAPGIALTPGTLSRGLHVEQTSRLLAPIAPGTTLTTVASLHVAEQRSTAVHLATEFTTTDEAGRLVAVTRTHMLYPGVRLIGEPLHAGTPPLHERSCCDACSPIAGFVVDETNAVIYTECARIWNPIHTDPRVARSAGLAGPVLHGTEILARAITAVTSAVLPGAREEVELLSCRFTAPVLAGEKLSVLACSGHAGRHHFEVVTAAGVTVLADGVIDLADTA